MVRLLTVIGARPQIIKAAAVSRAIATGFANQVEERMLHTGQHYDANMSGVFFDELGIPQPDYNLGVGSGRHGEQTAKMIVGIEKVLLDTSFDGIILYGDTNSTLAGAVAASKLHVPIYHVEAGLRSFVMAMPEEVNRLVCDRLSDVLFAPTATAVRNLEREGYGVAPNRQRVVQAGDVMYDNALFFGAMAEEKTDIMQRHGLQRENYVLATVHRDFNTDNPQRLRHIADALQQIAQQTMVVMPLHPRTAKKLNDLGCTLHGVKVIPPASFFEILTLERNAQVVVTDSGGVQKEAFFFGRPCVILRQETEWVEIVQHRAGILADDDTVRIVDAYRHVMENKVKFPPLFGDGHAAECILRHVLKKA